MARFLASTPRGSRGRAGGPVPGAVGDGSACTVSLVRAVAAAGLEDVTGLRYSSITSWSVSSGLGG
jgi:hypothetical protein